MPSISYSQLFALLAQAGPYGVLLVIIVAFVLGWISPKSVVDRQEQTINELKGDIKELNTELQIYQRLGAAGTKHAEELVELAQATAQRASRVRRPKRPDERR